jgi:hypothetical protein
MDKYTKLVLTLFGASLLVGCATTYPVVVVTESGDRFYGTASSSAVTGGDVEVSNAKGLSCVGEYEAEMVWSMDTATTTRGSIKCADGRSADWVVTGTARGGQGGGQLSDGEEVNVYFGNMTTKAPIE